MKKRKFAAGGMDTEEISQMPSEPRYGSPSDGSGMPRSGGLPGMKRPSMATKKVAPKSTESDSDSIDSILSERSKRAEEEGRDYGRKKGRERQEEASALSGVLGTPAAYVKRAGQYIGDKLTDADAYLSEQAGMKQRAAGLRGERRGLKEEGYKNGGMTASASKRGDGIAQRGKTRGKMC